MSNSTNPDPGLSTLVDEMPELETRRLIIEPLTAADASELAEPLATPDLYRFIGGVPPTPEELRTRFEAWEHRASPDASELWLNWTVRLRRSREAIGYVQATVADSSATIAYVLGLPWQHQGLAREAVQAMIDALKREFHVDEILANIAPGHAASQGVARAAGLNPTGAVTDEGEEVWATTP